MSPLDADELMNGCADFQVAIDMRLHGALSSERMHELEAHLEGCQACRDFQSTAQTVEDTMHAFSSHVDQTADWDRIRDRVKQLAKLHRSPLVPVLAGAVAVALVSVLDGTVNWGLGQPFQYDASRMIARFLVAVAALSIIRVLRNRRRQREFDEAEASREEFLNYYRKRLDRQVRDRRIITVLCWTLCALVAIVPNVLMLLREALATRPIAVEAVVAVVFAGTAIYVQRVELPRLRRERAELG